MSEIRKLTVDAGTGRQLQVGDLVNLSGQTFKVIRRPFGSAVIHRENGKQTVTDDRVTLTLERVQTQS